jgi:hypothetical protein
MQGGMAAAQSMYGANAYNPFATALTSFAANPAATRGLQGMFGGGFRTPGYGMSLGGVNPVSGEYLGSLEF